jgi:CRISPR type III-associated protein (TIGR04423 family)
MHTLIKIDDIPDYDYEGYYWYSDQSAPEVVFQQEKLVFKELLTILPFVVEGNFYAEQEKVSIQIRHIDGEYRIAQFDLKGLDGNTNYPIKHYIAHRLTDKGGKSITQYKMMEAWEEIEDPLLEGMKTLKPTWAAFCGFVK